MSLFVNNILYQVVALHYYKNLSSDYFVESDHRLN